MRKNTKILMVGILSREYVSDNWLLPLKELCTVKYISVSVLVRVMSLKDIVEYMLQIFRNDHYDYVFYYADGAHQVFCDRFFEEVRKTTPVISFYSDDEPMEWMQNNLQYDYRSDLIATHSKRAFEYRKELGYKDRVMYLQWGYNPMHFYPTKQEKKIDVAFLGTNFYADGRYYHDGEFRQLFLLRIYEYCKQKEYKFRIYGSHWEEHPVLKEVWGGFVPDEKLNDILNQVKICIGLGYTIDQSPTYQTKLKHFEIAGAGTFQIVNSNPDLEEIFGNTIPQADTVEEFCEKITYYLEHNEERIKLAKQAYSICSENCTTTRRLHTLFEFADNTFSLKQNNNCLYEEQGEKCKIGVIYVNKLVDNGLSIKKTINQYKEEGYTHVRFIEEGIKQLDFNEGLLDGLLHKEKSIRTSAMYSARNDNSNEESERQRRTFDDNAFLVDEKILKDDIWYQCLKENCIGIDVKDGFIPLNTCIFNINKAWVFYENFINQRVETIESIDYVRVIVQDFRLCPTGEYWKNREEKALKKYLDLSKGKGTVVIWGAYSMFSAQIFRVLAESSEKYDVVFVDKNSSAGRINVCQGNEPVYYPLLNSDELLKRMCLKPYAVVIGAVNSGESMMKLLKDRNVTFNILPLYDLNNEIWKLAGVF